MTKKELRQKLFDYFNENEIDYDQSRNTMTLYRWAIRNHGFQEIEDFEEPEPQPEPEPEPQPEPEPELQPESQPEPEPKIDPVTKKKEDKIEEAKIIKEKEEEKVKENDNWIWLLVLAFLAILFFKFFNKENNGTDTDE